MTAGPSGERAYARAIEAAWARMKGRPVVLSPREFELVSSWRRDGIPLRVVLEVLGEEARLAGRRREPRSLGFLASAVREAGQVVASGRAASVVSAAARPPAVELWRRALEAMPREAPIHAVIARLLAAASEGVAPDELDRRLDEELVHCAPSERLAAVSEASRVALAPFRERMSREEHERAIARAIVDRLRDALELPRAALSPSSKIG